MTDPMVLFMVVVGFAAIVVGGSRLGAGTTLSFRGFWARPDPRDWPRGVQEGDAPRFAVSHLDALRPGTPVFLGQATVTDPGEPRPEMIELDRTPHGADAESPATIRTVRTERPGH